MEYLGLYVLLGGIILAAWGFVLFVRYKARQEVRRHLKNLK